MPSACVVLKPYSLNLCGRRPPFGVGRLVDLDAMVRDRGDGLVVGDGSIGMEVRGGIGHGVSRVRGHGGGGGGQDKGFLRTARSK